MSQRKYSVEFKEEAVGLVVMEGMSVKEASEKLGVSEALLYRWRKDHLNQQRDSYEGMDRAAMADEMARLRKELGRAQRINEILKKTVGYFSKEAL
jgi:transposase